MKKMKFALPDDLRARLNAASARSGRSVADECRAAVEASFARDIVADVARRDFVEGVARMPAEVARECGAAWHQHRGAYRALVQAILSRLEHLEPEGPTTFGDRPHATTSETDPAKL